MRDEDPTVKVAWRGARSLLADEQAASGHGCHRRNYNAVDRRAAETVFAGSL